MNILTYILIKQKKQTIDSRYKNSCQLFYEIDDSATWR